VSARATAAPHPLVAAAGREGRLPEWARCGETRRAHIERVAGLMAEWAEALELPEAERVRWVAAARLHDALRDAAPEDLREAAAGGWPATREWPPKLLHGPACAARLRHEGVGDEGLLRAVAYHTVGHPELGRLGEYLYLADFLEPGRAYLPRVRERLRSILPAERLEALLSVVALRLAHRLEVRGAIRPETVGFWNRLVEEAT
jgi:HD superfamily phosphohydrolase YqeK